MNPLDQQNSAQVYQTWLQQVDLQNADVTATELQIYQALQLGATGNPYLPPPISPYAEPVNLQNLVGDLVSSSHEQINSFAQRVDALYSAINDLNNSAQAQLTTTESQVATATSNLQSVTTAVAALNNANYLWVSDTFSSKAFIDTTATTALIDTDYQMATLAVQSLTNITDFALSVNSYNGIPGCNMWINDISFSGTSSQAPTAELSQVNSANLGNILDGDPTTYFEVERNFIAPSERMVLDGQANVYSPSGNLKKVLSVTNNLDWLTYVQWGTNQVDQGNGPGQPGPGIPIADFVDISQVVTNGGDLTDYEVNFILTVTLNTPQMITAINMVPFIRATQQVKINSIQALCGSNWITIADITTLGSNIGLTAIEDAVLTATGVQSTGSVYTIPTTSPVSQIQINLSSAPEISPLGLGHIFLDLLHSYTSTRNDILWTSVDNWSAWVRTPINATPPTIVSSFTPANGTTTPNTSVVNGTQTAPAVGSVTSKGNVNSPTGLSGLQSLVTSSISSVGLGGLWKGLGSSTAPIIAGVSFAVNLISDLINNYSHTDTVEKGVQAYDIFQGYRAGIGIRDLSIVQAAYSSTSIVQSIQRTFSAPVSKIGLFVEQTIPDGWGQGDWITYAVSTDGINWSPLPQITDTNLDNGYTPPAPTTTVYFQATINGNPNDPYHTPQIESYAIQGLPA